jgi:HK97 gp10 family phage protein
VSVTGDFSAITRFAEKLETKSADVADLARKVVLKAAVDVQAGAQELAPVDTGNLRNSIVVQVSKVGSNAARSKTVADVGPTAEYGAHVEYGTVHTRPQPYLGPATDDVVPGFLAALAELGEM